MSVQHATLPPAPNGNGKPAPDGHAPCCEHAAPEPGAGCAPLKNAGGRTYWLAGPCPAWCDDTARHRNSDVGTDRLHAGVTNVIWLATGAGTTERGAERPDGSPDIDGWDIWPEAVRAWLCQEYREIGPRVGMTFRDDTEWYLTLAEAAELRDVLTSLIGQARP